MSKREQGYTSSEWKKIERLAKQKGKTFKTATEAKQYLKKLFFSKIISVIFLKNHCNQKLN